MRAPCPQPPPALTVPLPPLPSHVPLRLQAGTSSCETPTPATRSLGHINTNVRPKYATSLWLSKRAMGLLKAISLLEIQWRTRPLVPAAPEKWLPQLASSQRSLLLQTREHAPHGHTLTGCGSWSRVNVQNLGPKLRAIASGKQGMSESSHPHRELLFARTRWAERGVEGCGGGKPRTHVLQVGITLQRKALSPACGAGDSPLLAPQPQLGVTAWRCSPGQAALPGHRAAAGAGSMQAAQGHARHLSDYTASPSQNRRPAQNAQTVP